MAIISTKTTFPFLRNEIAHAGFMQKAIPYRRNTRRSGNSNYNLFGMAVFAVAGFLTTTTFPLRFIAYSFPIFALSSAIVGILWISSVAIWLMTLHVGLSLSLIAIYLARIYHNGVSRPPFLIDYEQSKLP